jgi:hypothetical protein
MVLDNHDTSQTARGHRAAQRKESPNMETIPRLFTFAEAAEVSKRTEKAMRQLRAHGRGPRVRNIDGRLLITEADLVEWLQGDDA